MNVTVPKPFLGTQQLSIHSGTAQHKAKTPGIQGLCCAGGAGWDGSLVALGMVWD